MIKAEFGAGEKRPEKLLQTALRIAQLAAQKFDGVFPFLAVRLASEHAHKGLIHTVANVRDFHEFIHGIPRMTSEQSVELRIVAEKERLAKIGHRFSGEHFRKTVGEERL